MVKKSINKAPQMKRSIKIDPNRFLFLICMTQESTSYGYSMVLVRTSCFLPRTPWISPNRHLFTLLSVCFPARRRDSNLMDAWLERRHGRVVALLRNGERRTSGNMEKRSLHFRVLLEERNGVGCRTGGGLQKKTGDMSNWKDGCLLFQRSKATVQQKCSVQSSGLKTCHEALPWHRSGVARGVDGGETSTRASLRQGLAPPNKFRMAEKRDSIINVEP